MNLFRQCRLRKSPNVFTYTWIPLKMAVKDKRLVLVGESGWVVDDVYRTTRDEGEVRIAEDVHRRCRSVTDI